MAKTQKESTPASTKMRVQFDFSRESLAKLDELVSAVNATTRAELIRRALVLFSTIIDAEAQGGKIYIREPDGELVRITHLF